MAVGWGSDILVSGGRGQGVVLDCVAHFSCACDENRAGEVLLGLIVLLLK